MNSFQKTAAAVAIIASFGVAHAQQGTKVDETVKQTQQPSSGMQPAPKTPTTGPKVDETVSQTQKPSSGMQPAPKTANSGPKVDETVSQTQRPGAVPPNGQTTTRSATTTPPMNAPMNAQAGSSMNNQGASMNSGSSMSAQGGQSAMSSDQSSMNAPMRRERRARSDRN